MFKFSSQSKAILSGVNPQLAKVPYLALDYSPIDFGIREGLRTLATQKKYLARGSTTTLNSKHLTANAIDVAPWVNGKFSDDWAHIYPVTEAMRSAAQVLEVSLRWGGAWDIDFTASTKPAKVLVEEYAQRRRAANKRVFLDGFHFELA